MSQFPTILSFLLFISCGSGNSFLETSKVISSQNPEIRPAPITSKSLEEQVKEISGQKLWLDSKNTPSLRSDSNCNATIVEGDKIGCWTDLSGNNNHLIQTNTNKQPKYENGVVTFDGGDFLIDEDGKDYINGSTGLEIIAVIKPAQVNTDRAFWDTEKRDNQDDLPSFRYDKKGWLNNCEQCLKIGVKTNQGASASESASFLQSLNEQIVNASWSSGSYPKIYDRGVEAVSTNPVNVSGEITGATRVMIGDGTKQAWKGQILEVLYYNRELSQAERGLLIQYLEEKWNL